MKSKTSFFNEGILLNDLKRFSWISIIYLILLFFSLPFKIINIYDNNKSRLQYQQSMRHIFSFGNNLVTVLICIMPVLIALMLFRYMQSKKSADMIHSLPIKREKLYNTHVFFGIITLIIPVIITAIICCILKGTLNLNDPKLNFAYKDVAYWAGVTILLTAFIFLFTVLMGMLTGLTTAQGILTYIFLFLPVGLIILVFYNISKFFYGFPYEFYIMNDLKSLSPFTRLESLNQSPMKFFEAITYIILCFITFIIGRVLYKKRKSEALSNAIAFEVLQPIFKYGVTFCCMLLGGFCFIQMEKNFYWIIFGYIFASLIGYIISEMIITKSLKVFKNLKGYCIFSAVMGILIVCINLDLIGFENKLPPLSKIESVYLSHNFYALDNNDDIIRSFKEPSNIENIQKFHKTIIDNKSTLKNATYRGSHSTPMALMYKLKNGNTIKREYMLLNDMYNKNFKDIYESKEYKKINYPLLSKDCNSIDKIYVDPYRGSHGEFVLTDPLEIKEFTDILKDEILNESFDSVRGSTLPWGHINIKFSSNEEDLEENNLKNVVHKNNDIYCNFEQSYTKLEKWLTEKNYIKSARIMAEDIDYVIIEKYTGHHKEIDENDKNVKRLEVKDKSQIETCLRNTYEFYNDDNAKYTIGFYNKNNNVFYGVLKKDNIPPFVTEYFK